MNAALDVLQSTHQHINRDRLWQSLMDLAKLGATPKGGVCRLALTDLDRPWPWRRVGPGPSVTATSGRG